MPIREAIGLIETISIAVGVRVTDEMAKTAPVEILEATAIIKQLIESSK